MTLDQLRIFVGVAEREHMTRAAEALNITQSAVSAAIKTLEERHGVALFHRVGRRIELTEIGAQLAPRRGADGTRATTRRRPRKGAREGRDSDAVQGPNSHPDGRHPGAGGLCRWRTTRSPSRTTDAAA